MIEKDKSLKIYSRPAPVPSRLIALVRLLIKLGELTRLEVLEYLHPVATRLKSQVELGEDTTIKVKETEQVKDILRAAEECGLIEIDGPNKMVRLSSGLNADETESNTLDETFPLTMARLVLRSEIQGEKNLFAEVCAWILCQPVVGLPEDRSGWKRRLSQQGLDLDATALRADLNWDMVFYWMRYLGLITRMEHEGVKGVVPNPTSFIMRHLDRLLPEKEKKMTAEKFRNRLGEICPVLDGGVVHQAVRKKYRSDWPEDLLSHALSFALERLARQKKLKYWCPDDQRRFLRTSFDDPIAFIARK